ncbi:Tex family protein [Basilea psittacipulmonis]|uniref:Transcription accessory protein n=1 Tax=Basilea psittacipulmonis DSM 24701 TaxID=1072685 RepID=A0A077DDL2_9BURK|nr:Tex family protein [Basilea psittacipulmonis]AIL32221.1 transcription accessory protein [Basilea psittacipulmonis DSM 24701]
MTKNIDEHRIIQTLSQKLNKPAHQIQAAVNLLDEGATVPFIARYRKEVTGGLDDAVLRELEVSLLYVRELEERRISILESIRSQEKLTPELEAAIMQADNKQRLEDLYAPYKPKRRTKAQIAKEAGLEPLADAILLENTDPQTLAQAYLNNDITDVKMALDGARDILAERFSENADLVATIREYLSKHAFLYSTLIEGKETEGDNFKDWFDFKEAVSTLPSHRILAMLRGRQQGVLDLRIGLESSLEEQHPHPCIEKIADFLDLDTDFTLEASPRQKWLSDLSRWTWRVKLLTLFETEIIGQLRDKAETEAIKVFAENLKDLLLAAPAGHKAVLGLDPGIRTGVKVAAIDKTGKLLETTTIYPFEPRLDKIGSMQTLAHLIQKHHIELIAIGNGTASRETEKLVSELLAALPNCETKKVVVSEAGASVYSASELASQEFPDLDVSLRGAVSIARRLQDPLAELVKIEPKSIGVGQYQHDLNQRELARSLDAVIEDCVNAVGVDVNTASAALLSRVSGLNAGLAKNIVSWRDENGAFKDRKALMAVPRFGAKAFEQAAGFLRISGGTNPLDQSAVHPEAYPVVSKILDKIHQDITSVIGNKEALKGLSPQDFTDEKFGLPTVKDIFNELEKPGRDPRPEFKTASFREDVHTIDDLKPGMILEGVVSNVANFGAFVDIGVHQDGLVHISALSNHFVQDPREVVRTGQLVKVKVLEVEPQRKRIALSMRLDDDTLPSSRSTRGPSSARQSFSSSKKEMAPQGAMAAAFAKLRK